MKTKRYEKLYELRKKNNLNIYEMGALLGVTGAYYWQLENKKRRLFYDIAMNIARIFNMNPDDIFYDEI